MQTYHRAVLRVATWLVPTLAASAALAAATVTFSEGKGGTFPSTLQWDRQSDVLTIDLSGVSRDATIFRAELYLKPRTRSERPPLEPTVVYPLGQPEKKLEFVAPRSVSLDALEAVQAAVKSGEPLQLKLESTLRGVERLEVSYLEGKARKRLPAISDLEATHRNGQSLIVFREPQLANFPAFKTGGEVAQFKEQLLQKHPGMTLRVWRSMKRISPATIAEAKLVGECGLMTGWNNTFHQGKTKEKPPVRYRVSDGGEPVRWGTGIYAHNPASAGKAHYAVTVAVDGEEDFDSLGSGNTTAQAIAETVGQGEPVLQWTEKFGQEQRWHYRYGELVRLIYTRWEAPPHASRPSVPIDYLVVIPLTPRPEGQLVEPKYKSYRIEPAPVGLHLHAWGGSLNGGYGWWYNGHRGALLIASNQVPYDWWTGYHEANGTCRTYGDGHVQPFTINRMLGFLDWATRQHREAPEDIRAVWPRLDLTRVFTAGNSMGGSGAPMYAIRYGDRIAWALGWVGVHVPEMSPQFKSSYLLCYGPRDAAVTIPDGKTSPWDHYSDVWWLKNHLAEDTGLIIASNGKNDGGIGWEQAYKFARALQDTRRPHYFNWDIQGHGSHTLIGANFDLDVRSDQTLPAFANCSLDDDIGTAKRKSDEQIEAEHRRQRAEIAAGKREHVHIDPYDGDLKGQYNAYLRWETDTIVDTPRTWEITVFLLEKAPRDSCTVDLTPRRCQQFEAQPGQRCKWTNTRLSDNRVVGEGTVVADELGLVTIQQLSASEAMNRIVITQQ